MVESIIQLPGKELGAGRAGEGATETTPPEIAAPPQGLGGREASPGWGPVVRKLPRRGLRAEREETCGSGREGSERAGWGRRAGDVGRAWPVNSSFPSLLQAHRRWMVVGKG